MKEYKNILITNSMNKAREALRDAESGMRERRITLILNRSYYAIFYSVLALGYKEGFITSKHSQLMGWFNKKFIFEEKVFDKRLNEIFKVSFINRQESDYDIAKPVDFDNAKLHKILSDSKYFVEEIEKYIDAKEE